MYFNHHDVFLINAPFGMQADVLQLLIVLQA